MKPTKKIDELAEQIDLTMNSTGGKKGLTIHFSTTSNIWEAYYGKNASTKHRCFGITAEEALQKLVEKMNTPINQDTTA